MELVVSNGSRVTTSRICIPPAGSVATAMKLLHGDHAMAKISLAHFKVAALEFHKVGIPCTTLTKGLACGAYNLHTSDALGDRGTAE